VVAFRHVENIGSGHIAVRKHSIHIVGIEKCVSLVAPIGHSDKTEYRGVIFSCVLFPADNCNC
jgi:hypothetical protein